MKSKLLALLNRLKLFKYRYKITCKFEDFTKYKLCGYNVKVVNGMSTYLLHFLPKDVFKDKDIIIEDRYLLFLKRLFKTKLVSSLSLIIILGLFVLSNFFIRDVRFTYENTYDYNVLEDVNKEIKTFGPFKRVEIDLNDLSNNLRQKYYDYAYIGVRKRAGTLYIDIEKTEKYPSLESVINDPCDIVSNVDGKVVGFEVVEGVPVVNINQIVRKGELLISGNINYQTDPKNLSNLIHARGIILLEYASYVKVEIPKIIKYDYLEPSYTKYLSFTLFNKNVGNNRMEEENDIVVSNQIINLGNVFLLNENTKYKLSKKERSVDLKEAEILSVQEIYTKFFEEQVSKSEKIKFVKFISVSENSNSFTFCYLVKCIKNACLNVYYE